MFHWSTVPLINRFTLLTVHPLNCLPLKCFTVQTSNRSTLAPVYPLNRFTIYLFHLSTVPLLNRFNFLNCSPSQHFHCSTFRTTTVWNSVLENVSSLDSGIASNEAPASQQGVWHTTKSSRADFHPTSKKKSALVELTSFSQGGGMTNHPLG